jgi:hypothetical protein
MKFNNKKNLSVLNSKKTFRFLANKGIKNSAKINIKDILGIIIPSLFVIGVTINEFRNKATNTNCI